MEKNCRELFETVLLIEAKNSDLRAYFLRKRIKIAVKYSPTDLFESKEKRNSRGVYRHTVRVGCFSINTFF